MQGDEHNPTELTRMWDDTFSLRMRFRPGQRIGKVGPAVRFEIGGREFTRMWVYSFGARVDVFEGGSIVTYQNASAPTAFRLM